MPEYLRPCAAPADTRQSPESAASTRPRAMKALTGSPTSTTKRPTTASHGPNALVWKRQPCAFRKCKLVHRKLCCIKFRTSQRLPEPSEDSLQMLGTQREKTSTVKACLTTLSRMDVAIAPMAKRNDIVRGLYSAAPSVAHRSSGLEPIDVPSGEEESLLEKRRDVRMWKRERERAGARARAGGCESEGESDAEGGVTMVKGEGGVRAR